MDSEDARLLLLRARHARLLARCLRDADAGVAIRFAAECETAAAKLLLTQRKQTGEAGSPTGEPARAAAAPETAQQRPRPEASTAA